MSNRLSKTARRALIGAGACLAVTAGAAAPSALAADCGAAADDTPRVWVVKGTFNGKPWNIYMHNGHQLTTATICLVNNEREARGLVRLSPNAELQAAADRHARDQQRHRFVSHTGSDGSTPGSRMAGYGAGRPWYFVAENLYTGWGAGYDTPRAAVRWWMGSPGHRASILNGGFRDTGAAVAAGTSGSTNGATLTMTYGARG